MVDPILNEILKEMWRLNDKLNANGLLTHSEQLYYDQHLEVITNYYNSNSRYWSDKQPLN